jgi:hypothetical protein
MLEMRQRVFHDLHNLSLSVKARLLRVNEEIRNARRFRNDELLKDLKEQRSTTDKLYSEILNVIDSEVYDQETLERIRSKYHCSENVFSDIS